MKNIKPNSKWLMTRQWPNCVFFKKNTGRKWKCLKLSIMKGNNRSRDHILKLPLQTSFKHRYLEVSTHNKKLKEWLKDLNPERLNQANWVFYHQEKKTEIDFSVQNKWITCLQRMMKLHRNLKFKGLKTCIKSSLQLLKETSNLKIKYIL